MANSEKTRADLVIADAARDLERNRCADIAMITARAISKGSLGRVGSIEEIGQRIADAIRQST